MQAFRSAIVAWLSAAALLAAAAGCGGETGQPATASTPAPGAEASESTPASTPEATEEPEQLSGALREAFEDGDCPTDEAEVAALFEPLEVAANPENGPGQCAFNNPEAFSGGQLTLIINFLYDAGDVLDTVREQSEQLSAEYRCDVEDDPVIGNDAYVMRCDLPARVLTEIHFRAGGNTWVAAAQIIGPETAQRPSAAEFERKVRRLVLAP